MEVSSSTGLQDWQCQLCNPCVRPWTSYPHIALPLAPLLAQEAAEHERLKSETYQRLNLGLMWWALGSLAVVWMAPVQPTPLVQG